MSGDDNPKSGAQILVHPGGGIHAFLKRLLSYRRRSWRFEDYPVRVWKQDAGAMPAKRGFTPAPWAATITNWLAMGGHGVTREEALADLRREFEEFRRTNPSLPRPGTFAPPALSSSTIVDRHKALARDFLVRILSVKNPDHCIIFDNTSLNEFGLDAPTDPVPGYLLRIREVYGVDVSNIEDRNLARIFERLAQYGKTPEFERLDRAVT